MKNEIVEYRNGQFSKKKSSTTITRVGHHKLEHYALSTHWVKKYFVT